MNMPMTVCAARRERCIVRMLMMCVVGVFMLVRQRFVCMGMSMAFRQVQPDSDYHQCSCHEQGRGYGVAQRNSQDGAKKWCNRKIGASTRRTQMTQANDE